MGDTSAWLLDSGEPWTRYRALLDLEGRPPDESAVVEARAEMLQAEPVKALLEQARTWPGHPLKRHNDAAHPLYAMSTLADLGLTREDPGVAEMAEAVTAHFDGDAFETLLWLPRFLTKDAEDAERWTWMLCDAPTLLYALLAFGYADDERVSAAVADLERRSVDNGWRCGAASSILKFGGPGRAEDTCPMATVYALKALSMTPLRDDATVTDPGIDAVLAHWQHQRDYKLRMFGIGTEFRKLRYPYVWYDILHVAEVLSRYPKAVTDPRFGEILDALTAQADADGHYTASAMYRAWKGWSFANKKRSSPWLTFLVRRVEARSAN